jgi:hypothetical protein
MRAVALPAAASSGPRPRECAGRRGQASPEHWLLAGPLTVLGWLSSVGGRSVARAGQRADGPMPAVEQTITTRLLDACLAPLTQRERQHALSEGRTRPLAQVIVEALRQ